MVSGATVMGIGVYSLKNMAVFADEMKTEHDRLFDHLRPEIPDILEKQGVTVNEDFRARCTGFLDRSLLETHDGMYMQERSGRLPRDAITNEVKRNIRLDNKVINGSKVWFVEYCDLTQNEKGYGVCYICGKAIPGNVVERRRLFDKDGHDFGVHSVHHNCAIPYVPPDKNILETYNGMYMQERTAQLPRDANGFMKEYIKRNNMVVNVSYVWFVGYDDLTPNEKVYGVCYLCGKAIPGNVVERRRLFDKKNYDCGIHSVHHNCHEPRGYD